MKLLILLARFPYPLEKGDKLRAFYQIKELSKNNEIYLITLNDKKITNDNFKNIANLCKEVHVININFWTKFWGIFYAFFKRIPFQCGYFFCRKGKKRVYELFERIKPDHIYVQMIRVVEYVKDLPIKKTLDYQDALSKGMQRRAEKVPYFLKPFFKIEYRNLQRYEHSAFSYFDNKTIITEVDRDLIPHEKNSMIHVIGNGVDFERYQNQHTEKKYDLIFSGNMAYPPNVAAAEYIAKQIFPVLQKEFPHLHLVICGANPSQKVKTLVNKNIIVTGWVNSMADYYAQSKIFIAPMQLGTGLQNKLIEAMAMKLPCITSTLAAKPINGIINGENMIVCETLTHYIDAVRLLLINDETCKAIAEKGYQLVKQHYNWEQINLKLESILRS
jgi:glycosyltransferase involved in cell wall biosynthesis